MRHMVMAMALVMSMAFTARAQEAAKGAEGDRPEGSDSQGPTKKHEQVTGELRMTKNDKFWLFIEEVPGRAGQMPQGKTLVFRMEGKDMIKEVKQLDAAGATIRVDYTVDAMTKENLAQTITRVEPPSQGQQKAPAQNNGP
jgi:hypothetical protein